MSTVTLKEKAYIGLRQAILSGELKPGEFLTERTLVEMLNMSRTPIRSALERLDAEGFANYTPNKGVVVAEISLKKASDLYDFRIVLESYVVRRLALLHWGEEDIAWFENNLQEQEQCVERGDDAGFTVADSQFHQQLAVVYDNSEIIRTMTQIGDKLLLVAMSVLRKDQSRIRVSYKDHATIFQHIISGEADLAAEAMENHLAFGKGIFIR